MHLIRPGSKFDPSQHTNIFSLDVKMQDSTIVNKKVVKKKAVEPTVAPTEPVALAEKKTKAVAPKKRTVKKKADSDAVVTKKVIDAHMKQYEVTDRATLNKLDSFIKRASSTSYDIDVQRDAWVSSNRAKFVNWVDVVFSQNKRQGSHDSKDMHVDSVSLFNHQKFIKDYMQFSSPYRGLLLFHGLGVGKSCSSIAAAELLSSHMKVTVMTPASLRDNYVNEIKKCGRRFFTVKQHWAFIPSQTLDALEKSTLEDIMRFVSLDKDFIEHAGGLWMPLPENPHNFDSMPPELQNMIHMQIDTMIQNRFQFINYNGLTRKKLQSIVDESGGNPFDNTCVVIDEVHNLISTICNGSQIGEALYKLLMQAKDMKLILLSGTPIINYPYEIAYLINLLTGFRKMYELKVKKDSPFDQNDVSAILNSDKYVDAFELDLNSKKISLTFLPEGFAKTRDGPSYIAREQLQSKPSSKNRFVTNEERLSLIIANLKEVGIDVMQKWSIKEMMTLPTKEEDFNEYFVDFENIRVKNSIMFMRRTLGVVSFYSTYSPELYPSVEISEVPLEMNDYQFNVYEKARGEERLKEKRNKGQGGKKDGNLFSSVGQVYRFYSRALCNFVFPEGITRPFPSKLAEIRKEVDFVEAETDADSAMDVADSNTGSSDAKANMAKEYMALVNKAIQTLRESGELDADKVAKWSPKFKMIYDKIQEIHGNVLIYSQFRKVEGLGLFAMCLEQNGYAEFKIKKVDGEWDIDIAEEDYAKPKYIMFTGSNETTRVLLNIYNSNLDAVPPKIVEKLHLLGGNNLHGDIIKVLMITKSGAEGISLKNVRQVHIMEPYWNHIRTDQVVGRAVRTRSHTDLPASERNVHVYVYYMKASQKQLQQSFSIRTQDKGLTSDEHIYVMAKKKAEIINQFLDLMKRASVDCAINAKKGDDLKCFAYPVNIDEDKLTFTLNITSDQSNAQYMSMVLENEWKGEVYMTRKGNFLIRRETGEVYDFDMYEASGRLVKLGVLKPAASASKGKKDVEGWK